MAESEDRLEQRRAKALRANLRRRKAQQRGRRDDAAEAASESQVTRRPNPDPDT